MNTQAAAAQYQQQPQSQQQGAPQTQQQYGHMPAPFYNTQQTHQYMPQHPSYWHNSSMSRQDQSPQDDKARRTGIAKKWWNVMLQAQSL